MADKAFGYFQKVKLQPVQSIVGRELGPLPETGLDLTQIYSHEQILRESLGTFTLNE